MPSHCFHDCACACKPIIQYVYETDNERTDRLNKAEKERQREIEMEKIRIQKEIDRLKKLITEKEKEINNI